MTWANEEKNGVDDLKIMDNGTNLSLLPEGTGSRFAALGDAADSLRSLQLLLWPMLNLLVLESTYGHHTSLSNTGGREKKLPLANGGRMESCGCWYLPPARR